MHVTISFKSIFPVNVCLCFLFLLRRIALQAAPLPHKYSIAEWWKLTMYELLLSFFFFCHSKLNVVYPCVCSFVCLHFVTIVLTSSTFARHTHKHNWQTTATNCCISIILFTSIPMCYNFYICLVDGFFFYLYSFSYFSFFWNF